MIKENNYLYTKIFNFCYALYLISFIFFANSTINSIFSYANKINQDILIFVIFLLIILFFLSPKNTKMFLGYIGISVISFLCFYSSRNIGIVLLTLFVINSQVSNLKNLIKIDFYIRLVLTVILVSLSLLNIIPNYISDYDGRFRGAFGFIHPNTTGAMVLILILDYLAIKYLNKETLSFVNYLIIFVILIILNLFVNARSAETGVAVAIILSLVFKHNPVHLKKLYVISIGLIVILPFLSIFLAQKFDRTNSNFLFINSLLSGRLDYQNQILLFYNKPTLFGQTLSIIGEKNVFLGNTYVLDSSYIMSYLGSGIIGSIMLFGLLLYLMFRSIKVNNFILWIWIVALLVWSVAESQLFVIGYSLPFLLIFSPQIKVENM